MLYETTNTRPLFGGATTLDLVRRPIADGSEYSHILVPTALTRRDQPALTLGLQMAAAVGAKVTLLHVAPIPEPTNSWHWLDAIDNLHKAMSPPGNPELSSDLEMLEHSRTQVTAYLEREIPAHLRSRAEVHVECRLGEVTDEILRFADNASVDLVILSSRLSRWWLPIVPARVHRVLLQMRKRVVVVRPDAAGVGNGHSGA